MNELNIIMIIQNFSTIQIADFFRYKIMCVERAREKSAFRQISTFDARHLSLSHIKEYGE